MSPEGEGERLPRLSAMNQHQTSIQISLLRRVIDLWPYVFIVISLSGLGYMAFTAAP